MEKASCACGRSSKVIHASGKSSKAQMAETVQLVFDRIMLVGTFQELVAAGSVVA